MKKIILASVTLLSFAGIASAADPPDRTALFPDALPQVLAATPPTLASTYQCLFHNSPLAIKQSLRLAAASSDCLKYCQQTYPCPGGNINIPVCSKLKACMESCG
jgi:hypothetical protein